MREKKAKAISAYVPLPLYEKMREKMKEESFLKDSRLVVYLIRRWVET